MEVKRVEVKCKEHTKDQGSEEAKKKLFDIGVKMYNLDEKESQELKNSMEKPLEKIKGVVEFNCEMFIHLFLKIILINTLIGEKCLLIRSSFTDLIQKEKDKEIQQCQNKTNDFKTQIFSSMDDYRQKLELFKQDIKQNHPVCNTVTVKNEPNLLNLLLETIEKDKQIQEKVEKILAPPLPEPVPPPIPEPVPPSPEEELEKKKEEEEKSKEELEKKKRRRRKSKEELEKKKEEEEKI